MPMAEGLEIHNANHASQLPTMEIYHVPETRRQQNLNFIYLQWLLLSELFVDSYRTDGFQDSITSVLIHGIKDSSLTVE